MNDELYIGWQARAPAAIGAYVRKTVTCLLLLAPVVACSLALAQRTIGVAVFEWGKVKTFSGLLQARPYPHLLVPRPGQSGGDVSTYHLVAPFKFGLNQEALAGLDGRLVTLRGTLIYRGDQTMIEAQPQTIQAVASQTPVAAIPEPVSLGRQTLAGEIVDSKCYLGVMNPGQLTPHRACAVRCISGGIPPVLLVRQTHGPPFYFLLVSSAGLPVNKQVLNIVAEPVEITGEVFRQGDLLILRADPATYRPAGAALSNPRGADSTGSAHTSTNSFNFVPNSTPQAGAQGASGIVAEA